MARRTKEEAEKTRHALLDAAEKVFYKSGVSSTTLEQIAQAAGLTRGAVYWHFKDKGALCDAMMQRIFLPQEEILDQLATSKTATLNDLKEAVLCCLRQIDSDKRRQRVISILFHRCEYLEGMAFFLKRRNQAKDRMLARSQLMFERAHSVKKLTEPWTPAIAAAALQSLINGLITSAVEGRKAFKLSTTGVACIDAFFASLTAR